MYSAAQEILIPSAKQKLVQGNSELDSAWEDYSLSFREVEEQYEEEGKALNESFQEACRSGNFDRAVSLIKDHNRLLFGRTPIIITKREFVMQISDIDQAPCLNLASQANSPELVSLS